MTEEKLLEQAKALAKQLGYIPGRLIIARALGVGQNSARRITRLLKNSNIDYNGKPSSVDKPKVVSFESAKDKDGNQIHQATIRSNQRFHSVEELAEYCDIDLNIWDAVKVVANEWNNSDKFVCWQFKVWFKRRKDITAEDLMEAYKEVSAEFEPIDFPKVSYEPGSYLLNVSISDPHIGRLSWHRETKGNNYDLKIACKRYLQINQYFVNQFSGLPIDLVLLPLGNDYFNVNSDRNTTVNNTPQDEDCRGAKTLRAGLELAIQTIEIWRAVAPVHIVFVYGNHARERLFAMALALEMFYKKTDNITMDIDPQDHKYKRWEKVLLGFTHKMKDYKNANNLFLADAKELIPGAKCLEYHTGHFHNERTVESLGETTIRTLPSLAELSYWESSAGYRSLKKAMAFLYDKRGALSRIEYASTNIIKEE